MPVAQLPTSLRCPLCLERFVARSAEGPLVRCGECGTIAHQACRQELGPCPVMGCAGWTGPAPARTPEPLRFRSEPSHHAQEFRRLTSVFRRHPERFLVAALLGAAYCLFWPKPEPVQHICYHPPRLEREIERRMPALGKRDGEANALLPLQEDLPLDLAVLDARHDEAPRRLPRVLRLGVGLDEHEALAGAEADEAANH